MRGYLRYLCLCLASFNVITSPATAKVTLPAIFNHHMVLQQNSEIVLWGWAKPLEEVTVIASWNRQALQTKADNHANWRVQLNTPPAGGPYSLIIMGHNTIILEDVLVGEVWLCSGQSNMEWPAGAGIDNAAQEIQDANYPDIRFFQVTHKSADVRQLDLDGQWTICTPQTMKDFSAVGYFFGRELFESLNVPIGLINSSWGGTPAEAWLNPAVVSTNEEFAGSAAKFTDVPWCPVESGSAYHAMIAPLIPYQIAGVIWYQGETNTLNPAEYRRLFPALMESWRKEWGKDFPFYYVQIAPYKYGRSNEGVLLRESQLMSMSVPNTGMVVTSDIGNIDDIHPRNKHDVGERLANWALARAYGKEGITFSGPVYREMKTEGEKIRLFFDFAEHGLQRKGEKLTHFQIAEKDRKFVDAEAEIDGNTVVAYASAVKNPVAVRFAWSNTAEPNLFNTEGLPASCFRTDDWAIKLE
ncbi:MAG TPA: sialate O-acetylesterase [bacterium]